MTNNTPRCRKAAIPFVLAGLLFYSCPHPANTNGGSDLIDARQPVIDTQPTGGPWDVGDKDTFTLTVTATSPDGGELSYQWYSNTSNSTTGAEPIEGTKAVTLTLNKTDYTENGDYYFYVVVTNTIDDNGDGGDKTATATGNVTTVQVNGNGGTYLVNAEEPVIDTQPAGGPWDVSGKDTFTLTVTATSPDGGELSYRWYSNTTNSTTGGEPIDGAEAATLTFNKTDYTENGDYYFYVTVTNTIDDNGDGGTKTATVTGGVATVSVTGNEYILIYSPEDMAKIGVVNTHPLSGTYLLKNDMTLADYIPIGTATTPFTGTFDGDRKTITVNSFASVTANRDIGIFGYVKGASTSSKAVIKNLTVNSAINVTGTAAILFQNVGLVAGYAEYAEINNIALLGNFSYTSDGRIHLGGIAGTINQTGTVIKNSTSSMTMNINPAGSGTPAPVNGGTGQHWVGGFAGLFHNGASIENCHNSGNLTVDNVARSGGQVYAGGIAGGSYCGMSSANYSGYIQDSSYTGNITVSNTGNWTFAAGIAGTIVGGTVNNLNATTKIVRCFVTGTVSCENTSAGYPYIGGIVAYNYYGALVSQSYFTGTIIQKGRATNGYTGGIAGYNSQAAAPNNSRLDDCWSGGTILGTTNNINNITGQQPAGATSARCYVIQVLSNGTYRGGIVGTAAATDSNVVVNPTAKPAQSEYTDAGWDFTNVWKWDSASGYPKLMWQ